MLNSKPGRILRQVLWMALGAAALSTVPSQAEAASLMRVPWEGLSVVVGKTVSIAMPGGTEIIGIATGVESDALVVNVTKTTDPKAYPKGALRVLRATLHVLEMRTKGKKFRAIVTTLGGLLGLFLGTGTAVAIDWHGDHDRAAWGILIGATAAGTVGGYIGGNAADRRWTTIEIQPN